MEIIEHHWKSKNIFWHKVWKFRGFIQKLNSQGSWGLRVVPKRILTLIWWLFINSNTCIFSIVKNRCLTFCLWNHGTIILTGITCKKIGCYMRDSASNLLLKILKYFEVRLNIFEFSHVNEIVKSWLVYENKFSWIIQSGFLTETIKES